MAKARIYNMEIAVGVNGKNVFSSTKKIANAIKNIGKKAKIDVKTEAAEKELRDLDKAIEATEKEIEKLTKKQKSIEKANIDTKEYKDLQKEAAAAERQINTMKEALAAGVHSPQTAVFSQKAINEQEASLIRIKDRMEEIAQNGATGRETNAWYETADAIDRASDQLTEYRARRDAIANGGKWGDLTTGQKMVEVLKRVGSTARAGSKSLAGMAGRGVVAGFRKLGSAVTTLNRKIIQSTANLKNMRRGLVMGAGIKNLARLGMAAGGVYAGVRMTKQGLENLAQYSAPVNNSISSIMTSLLQLKNALATAFAPILNVVAPILTKFIDMLSRAATAVAHFFSALTGKKTVVVAKKATVDYAAGLNTASKNAEKADKAQKKLNKTLMGFDQINKLESNKDSATKTPSSGSAGGYTGPSPADMFETVEVSKKAKGWADEIKKAWAEADFTNIGRTVGNKINNALEKLDWVKIKNTARNIGYSIATFINGFLEGTNWKLVGRTIGEGINTGLTFAEAFTRKLKWGLIGKAVADMLTNAVSTIDIGLVAKTLSNVLKGLPQMLSGFLQNVPWQKVGPGLLKGLKKFAKNFDWAGVASSWFEFLGSALGAAAGLAAGLIKALKKAIKTAFKKVKKYFKDKAAESGGNIPLGILKGIKDGFVGIVSWIKKNVFNPFIDGFKKAFGIKSPSKEMEEPGKQIILGVLEGIKNNVEDLFEWFADLPGKIKDKIGEIGDIVVSVTGKIGDWATDKFEKIKNWIASTDGKIGSWLTDKFEKIPNFVGSVSGKIGSWLTDKFEKISDFVGSVSGKIGSWLTDKFEKISNFVGSVSGKIGSWATNTFATITGYVGSVAGKIGSWTTSAFATITGYVGSVAGKIGSWIKKPLEGLSTLTASVAGKVSSWADKPLSSLSTLTASVAAKVSSWANKPLDGLSTLTASVAAKISSWKKNKKGKVKLPSTKNLVVGLKAKLTGWIRGATKDLNKVISLKAKISGWAKGWADKIKNTEVNVTAKKRRSNAEGGIYKNDRWRPVQTAATGGAFSQGQMFIAREAGPELVGTIGGNTAVMNNDQIVSSVAAGVYKAVVSAMSQSSGDKSTTVMLQGDAAKFFKVIRDEAKNYTMATGQPAF